MMYDVIILGAGPAGLSAAIYAGRAGFRTLVLEKMFAGGQITKTHLLENYLGFENGINGIDFAMAGYAQAQHAGAEFKTQTPTAITQIEEGWQITAGEDVYQTKTVVLAMGAQPRPLGISGEKEMTGAGISYCATCDGALYKGKTAAVVGGGDTALEDAVYLSKFAKKVYLIHRREGFRAQKIAIDRAKQTDNIEFLLNRIPTTILGEEQFEGLTLENKATGETEELTVDGCFVAIGNIPDTDLVKGIVDLDAAGYIVAGEDTKTSTPGIFAAGDIRTKRLRQVVTAASDGAVAISAVSDYLLEQNS